MEAKKQILASQISLKRRLQNEKLLERDLNRFFLRLKKEVLKALEEYWRDYHMLQGHINLICSPVHEAHKEYYEILEKYIKREYKLGQAEAKRAVERMNKHHRFAFKEIKTMPIAGFIRRDNDLFATSPKAEQDLLNRSFRASERTMSRVDNQINQIITDGYRSGKGINDIGQQLSKRFDQLATWESRRIARTEVNTSHNVATVDTYRDMGVEYTQWIAANDDRTRDSHAEVDGEIIPMGGKYSNGLSYPGDMSGPIEEWINCRCSNAPFVIPYGYLAPSFSPFREEDLVPIDNAKTVDEIVKPTEPTIAESTSNIPSNLTGRDLEKYNKLQENIEKATAKLEQLADNDPRRIMYESRIKSAQSRMKKLERKSSKPSKPAVERKPTKPKYPIKVETPKEAINLKEELQAKSVRSEIASNKHTLDIYEFEGYSVAMDRELMHSKNVPTVKEIRDHLNTLPEPLRTTGVQINVVNIWEPGVAGYYYESTHQIDIFNNGNRVKTTSEFIRNVKSTVLDAVTHEVAHSYDLKNYNNLSQTGNIATKEAWGKVCKEDDKLYKYRDKRTGRMRTPRTFPTGYGSESWYKASRSSNYNKKATQYCEDFAESVKLYLNPITHKEFVKQYPNRANFLKEHFGTPNFKNYIVHKIKEVAE